MGEARQQLLDLTGALAPVPRRQPAAPGPSRLVRDRGIPARALRCGGRRAGSAPGPDAARAVQPARDGADKVLAFDLLPLEEVKAVRRAFGVTVNDVLLALVTGAVRDYLSARDELPEAPLVALCPMNMRAGDEEHMGNDFAMMWNRLPTQLADPVERLQAIRDETSVNKRVAAARRAAGNPADAVLEIPPPTVWGFIVSVAQSTLSRFVPPFANVIVSNVAGSPAPLYFCGARIEHLYEGMQDHLRILQGAAAANASA